MTGTRERDTNLLTNSIQTFPRHLNSACTPLKLTNWDNINPSNTIKHHLSTNPIIEKPPINPLQPNPARWRIALIPKINTPFNLESEASHHVAICMDDIARRGVERRVDPVGPVVLERGAILESQRDQNGPWTSEADSWRFWRAWNGRGCLGGYGRWRGWRNP